MVDANGNGRVLTEGPDKLIVPPPGYEPARELPIGIDWLAGGFPIFSDPIAELNSTAYTMIRRCDATSAPVNKLASFVSSMRMVARGEGPRVEWFQKYVLDRIPRRKAILKEAVWSYVEGVSFGWMSAKEMGDGVAVPKISMRRKAKAGGYIEWDGQRIVVQKRLAVATTVPDEWKAEHELPRNRFIVFRPGAGASPEGDAWLGWQLMVIADAYTDLDKNKREYSNRHGLPYRYFRGMADGVAPNKLASIIAQQRVQAERALQGPKEAGFMPSQAMLEIMEPGGTSYQFLSSETLDLRTRAQLAVLLATLTSETATAGPTGSSQIHADQQRAAVKDVADFLGETFTDDMLPVVAAWNEPRGLMPEGRIDAIELEPVGEEQSDVTPEQAMVYAREVEHDAEWLASIHGTTPPAGVTGEQEPLNKQNQQQGFGGFGGFGGGGRFGGLAQLAADKQSRAERKAQREAGPAAGQRNLTDPLERVRDAHSAAAMLVASRLVNDDDGTLNDDDLEQLADSLTTVLEDAATLGRRDVAGYSSALAYDPNQPRGTDGRWVKGGGAGGGGGSDSAPASSDGKRPLREKIPTSGTFDPLGDNDIFDKVANAPDRIGDAINRVLGSDFPTKHDRDIKPYKKPQSIFHRAANAVGDVVNKVVGSDAPAVKKRVGGAYDPDRANDIFSVISNLPDKFGDFLNRVLGSDFKGKEVKMNRLSKGFGAVITDALSDRKSGGAKLAQDSEPLQVEADDETIDDLVRLYVILALDDAAMLQLVRVGEDVADG